MTSKVTKDMNTSLLIEFITLEMEVAIPQMNPLNSPGLDDFPTTFYQNNWNIIRQEVCKAVPEFLNPYGWIDNINETYIALIP